MSFRNIKGQDNAIKFLKGSLDNNRIAHAYIFLGPGGVGKTLTAYNFAKAMNCASPEMNEPCDKCPSCKKIYSFNHPDVMTLESEKDGSSIKIDKIREMIKSIGLKPYEGRKKVYIIDGADFMTQEASNAILKTLEEPPSETVIILIAWNTNSIFKTIISRSQVVRFFPLGFNEVKEILSKEHAVDNIKAHILSHLSSGRLGEALKKRGDPDFFNMRSGLINAFVNRTLLNMDIEKTPKEELGMKLDIMLTWYRDILVKKAGSETSMLINIDKEHAISEEAKKLDFDHICNVIDEIISTNIRLEQNANPKLAMGMLGLAL